MSWTEDIGAAIDAIEAHIEDEIDVTALARSMGLSPFYFQKGFAMLCGYTLGEYIRSRRLALAGSELMSSDARVIDLAFKYGYDSPDSFTRAFTRFHGATPAAVRKGSATIKSFAPLKLRLTMKGGTSMEYRIVDKAAFTVMGREKHFRYESARTDIPAFWQEHFRTGGNKQVCGEYGINIDEHMGGESFDYLIADNYNPVEPLPEGCVTRTIPAFTWAVFPCRGPMPASLQNVNEKIFSEWLPACRDYEIAAGYCIEMYDDPARYANGTQSEDYLTEIWIPVRKK